MRNYLKLDYLLDTEAQIAVSVLSFGVNAAVTYSLKK